MDSQSQAILSASQDRDELLRAGVRLGGSRNAEDHRALATQLAAESFLRRLDSEREYEEEPARLRVRKLVEALSQNESRSAREALRGLTRASTFAEDPERVDILVQFLAVMRPAPQEAIGYWDAHCQPNDSSRHLVISSLLDNGSEEALALLERKLVDQRFPKEGRQWWMRSAILPHRDTPAVLQTCGRLIRGTALEESLRLDLLAVLFDYRHDEWFGALDHRPPPNRAAASPEAQGILRDLGRWALANLALSADLRAQILVSIGLPPEDAEAEREAP